MLGHTLLSRTVACMTLNKWLRRVCKRGFLEIRTLCSREFLGGDLVRAHESVAHYLTQMDSKQKAQSKSLLAWRLTLNAHGLASKLDS
jgi:hypothetical protein